MNEIRFGLVVAAACVACTRPLPRCVCGTIDPGAHRSFGIHV